MLVFLEAVSDNGSRRCTEAICSSVFSCCPAHFDPGCPMHFDSLKKAFSPFGIFKTSPLCATIRVSPVTKTSNSVAVTPSAKDDKDTESVKLSEPIARMKPETV